EARDRARIAGVTRRGLGGLRLGGPGDRGGDEHAGAGGDRERRYPRRHRPRRPASDADRHELWLRPARLGARRAPPHRGPDDGTEAGALDPVPIGLNQANRANRVVAYIWSPSRPLTMIHRVWEGL